MKRLLVSLVALPLFLVACGPDATAPTGENRVLTPSFQQGPIVHWVKVGGPDVCTGLGAPPGCDANYSISAIQYADGSVSGQYTDRFAGGGGFHAVVNCLNVVGNEAWISGVITQSNAFPDGTPVITRVLDVGTSANDPPDQISFSLIGAALSCLAAPPLPLVPAREGQVIVE